LTIIARWSRSR